jgi:hypothetical protein
VFGPLPAAELCTGVVHRLDYGLIQFEGGTSHLANPPEAALSFAAPDHPALSFYHPQKSISYPPHFRKLLSRLAPDTYVLSISTKTASVSFIAFLCFFFSSSRKPIAARDVFIKF